MLPKEVSHEFFKISKRVALIVALLACSAFLIGNNDVGLGIIIGGFMGIVNFRLLAINTTQLMEFREPNSARVRAIIQYTIRYIMTGGILYVGFVTPELSFTAMVIGLLLVKYVILFGGIYVSLKNVIEEFWKNLKLKYERRDS